ncbi:MULTISPECIES: hypothetical protein [unclassified Mesorhizobium]|uniref:hypothetical protein n=1 Tax=unclassified Mesorhizobium TaxID=325217 RepID=UPI00112E7EBD|nr:MULTISPECIES: hypothetical protein [unclassified Mesorhizobium]MBZ9701596.1 hypothetical protein [Mesorhizobium sp. CO1-1-3]MBZ9949206.1 hypothetical protein [Mesorhizobium sp. BR1-1-11]TPI99596.1 hypothetical protein FJ428_21940 [Mesorhizobium sp. B2-8-1]TPL14821.1 hypothetical protein FJ945_29840 [Mesorhizobium sp. B2-4-9]
MKDHRPVPRPNLFTVGDADAWEEQFHLLFYVLSMDAEQIAQIDHGFDPDDPDAWLACMWAREIERDHPFVNVQRIVDQLKRRR